MIERFGLGWFWAGLVWASLGQAEIFILQREAGAELVSVQEVREGGGKISYREMDGTVREVEKEKILTKLPSTPLAEQELTREEAVAAINAILEAKAKHPALAEPLQREVEIWKERLDKMPNSEDPEALAKAEAAFTAAVERIVPAAYAPKKNYTLDELVQQLAALDGLAREFPERAGEVEKLASPWRVEEEQHRAGKKKFEGRWFEPQEWEQERFARQGAAKSAFLETIETPAVSPILLGQGIFLVTLALFLGGALLGFSFLYHGVVELMRYRAWWKGAAWTLAGMILFAVVARGGVLAVAVPEPLPFGVGAEGQTLDDLVWIQAGLQEPLPQEIRLTDGEVNSWWDRRLRFAPMDVTDVLAVSVVSWRIQFVDGGINLERAGRWLGQTLLLRHKLIFSRSEKGEDIYRVEASLGKLPLPPVLVLRTWNQWVESLFQQAKLCPGATGVKLERLEKGAVVLSAP